MMTDRFYIDHKKRRLNEIKNLFYSNHGYLQIKELRTKGLKLTDIRFLQEHGVIMRVEQGLYKWVGENRYGYLNDVANTVPGGVFCLVSALHLHHLIADVPSVCYVAVPNDDKTYSLPVYPKVQLIKMKPYHFDLGITETKVAEFKVKLYDKEKTLCDCLRYRNKIGLDVIEKAFNTYKTKYIPNEKLLWEYGAAMRMKLILNRFLPKYL